MKVWRVLYTNPNAEYHVLNALRQEQIETYFPEIDTLNARGEKKKAPFFPNYVFAHLELENVQISKLRWTPGLRYILSFGGKPAVVPIKLLP